MVTTKAKRSSRKSTFDSAKFAQKLELMESVTSGIKPDEKSVMIPLDLIALPPQLNRYHIDETALDDLKDSIKRQGALEQILVRSLPNGQYELISGYRIFLARKSLKHKLVEAKILEVDEDKAREIALVKNLLKEELNPLEETEAILRLLQVRLKLNNIDEVRHQLYQIRNQMERIKKGKTLSDSTRNNVVPKGNIKIIDETLAAMGSNTLRSFISHRLSIITRVQDDVKQVLREGKIEYTKGLQICRIKDDKKRAEFLSEVLASSPPYTTSLIKSKVDELLQPKYSQRERKRMAISSRIKSLAKTYEQVELSTKQESEIKALLGKIEAILKK